MKTITLTHRLSDLGAFLRGTDADEIIARTTYIPGGWHEAEFVANRAGFKISRFIHEDYTYCFNVTENEREKLQANIQEVLNSIVFRSYGMQPHFQAVQVEIRKTEK